MTLDPTMFRVMVQLAGSQMRLLREQGRSSSYGELAAFGVREYVRACLVPIRMTAQDRAAYERAIVPELMKIDRTLSGDHD